MLQSNFTVFLPCAVTDLVCKLCAAVQELCLLPTCRATWNPMRGLRFPDNLMSNTHIRNARGISFLVSLLLKKDAGEERGSGLANKGKRTYHLPSALGQKIEISYFFSFFLFFLFFLSFFPSLSFLVTCSLLIFSKAFHLSLLHSVNSLHSFFSSLVRFYLLCFLAIMNSSLLPNLRLFLLYLHLSYSVFMKTPWQ